MDQKILNFLQNAVSDSMDLLIGKLSHLPPPIYFFAIGVEVDNVNTYKGKQNSFLMAVEN